jgi:hypothetical protein
MALNTDDHLNYIMAQNFFRTPQTTRCMSNIQTNLKIVYRQTNSIYSENSTEHITVCLPKVERVS